MAVITVEGSTSTRAPQSRGLTNDRHLQARADGLTAAQDERPQSTLWYSVPDSVHCSRTSVLPRLGLARDPGGSCPRRTNSARTTSRPVTRTSRRTGEPPPTPHRCLGESHAAVHSNPTLPDAAGPTGDSGDSDTFTKARRYKDVRAGKARDDYPSTRRGAPAGPAPAPPANNRAPRAGIRKPGSQSPNVNWNRAGPRPSPRGTKFKSTAQVNSTHASGP